MRVCYDYQAFVDKKYGGIARYIVEVASRLHGYPDTNVQIIAPLYRSELLAAKANALSVFGFPFPYDIKGAARLMRRLDSKVARPLATVYRPDIVHETSYSSVRTSSTSAKIILTVHDLIPELFPEYFAAGRRIIEERKAAFMRADHLICISESTRADLMRLYQVEPGRITVVHHASSLVAPTGRLALPYPFFLYVGGRYEYKNFLGLVAAFAESQLFNTHRLVCFGGGQLTPIELEKIRRLRVPSDRVITVHGDDELLSRYYASAEALVYPSLYEGFGIPLLEAMTCGCAVICNRSSSLPEVAGDAALYCDAKNTESLSNAMRRVSQEPSERSMLVSKGRDRVREFSWDACAQQTYEVYVKVMDKF